MIIRFKSFGPLRRLIEKRQVLLDVPDNSTIEDLIQEVINRWGEEARKLIMDGTKVSGNLIIMRNMKDVNTLQGLQTRLQPEDEITILPHVQGG